jgi:UDP-GlcNAc:undecaprenyl-phosphate GlcNAc-1-phosphate transferase
VRISFIPHYLPKTVLEIIITIVWFVGIINAINFLDGIDGLVASIAIQCSFLFLLIAWPTEQRYVAFVNAAMIGACLGFLPYNWGGKAKIFLGDSGATFIGFMLAGISIMGSWAENNSTVAFSTPLLILAVPIFDMIYTTISRVRNGHVKTVKQWIEYVGKDHFHHRLIKIGLSVKGSVWFIILVNMALGLGALIIRDTGTKGSYILLLQAFSILIIIVVLMLVGRERT